MLTCMKEGKKKMQRAKWKKAWYMLTCMQETKRYKKNKIKYSMQLAKYKGDPKINCYLYLSNPHILFPRVMCQLNS
jgi:hypothetical protein